MHEQDDWRNHKGGITVIKREDLVKMKLQLFASEGEVDEHGNLIDHQDSEPDGDDKEFDLEAFKLFAETNPDAKAFIQQSTQAKIDKGVQSMFENKKEELIAQAKLEASNLSPEAKEIEKMKLDLQAIKNEKALSDNRALVLQELNDIELDSTVKPYVQQMALDMVDTDPKKTSEMLGNLTTVIEKIVETSNRQFTYDSVNNMNKVREDATPSSQPSEPQRDMLDPNSYGKAQIGKAIFGN